MKNNSKVQDDGPEKSNFVKKKKTKQNTGRADGWATTRTFKPKLKEPLSDGPGRSGMLVSEEPDGGGGINELGRP